MAKANGRSAWWRIHSWAGLKLSVLLTFILATGTLATVSNEIDWLLTPAMRSSVSAGRVVDWAALHRTALSHAEGGRVDILRAPLETGFAAQAIVALPSGESRRIWANPHDGQFTGATSWHNVQQVLRQLHRRLMLPNGPGYFFVSLFSALLATLLVTGLVSYKRFWRGFLNFPRYRRSQLRRFAGDLHRFAALWSIWFMAIMAVTGLLYLAGSVGIAPAGRSTTATPTMASGIRTTIDQCLALLPERVRGLDITVVVLPDKAGAPIVAMGQGSALLTEYNGNRVSIDPARCTVSRHAFAIDQSVIARVFLASNPLHFGTFGGLATKLLWFAFGCILTGIAITGSVIYALHVARDFGPVAPGAFIRWRRGMGGWKYFTFGTLAVVVLITLGALLGPLSFVLDDWILW